MKLYARPGSFRAQKVIIAAQYAGANLAIETENIEKSVKSAGLFGKVPLLTTEEGDLFESNAIAKYLIKKGGKATNQLLGATAIEQAQIDMWVDFSSDEIEIPATVAAYPIIGWMPLHSEAFDNAKKDLNKSLQVLESHLKSRTFLVGNRVSYADITLASALLLPFKMIFDAKLQKTFTCVTRWFLTCVNQPAFVKVVGKTVLCTKAIVPAGYKAPKAKGGNKPKAEKKKVEKKKEEPKKETAAAPAAPAKKPKHYCEELPKSSFVMDEWKRTYSNAKKPYNVMPWLWENLDKEGYSLWIGDYKYNDELEVPFMVSNLCGGFVQRCDEIRKYAFGVIEILKTKEGKMVVQSAWLFRGQTEKLILDANPDAETYKWTKVDYSDEKAKQLVADLWCAEEEINGMEILDSKIFK